MFAYKLHPSHAKSSALGNFHRIPNLLLYLLANAEGIAAKGLELHFMKQKLSFLNCRC